MKKISAVLLCLSAFVPMSQLAFAGETFSSQRLGVVQAVFDYCEGVNPRDHGRLVVKEKQLLKGVSEREIEKARRGNDFGTAYSVIKRVLDTEIRQADAPTFCATL